MEISKIAVNHLLIRGESFTFKALANSFMAGYVGRDKSFHSKLQFFVHQMGDLIASEIDSDHVDDSLKTLIKRGKIHNRGGTKPGGVLSSTHEPLADGTINRYRGTLQSVLTWARKKRLMPKGWINPVIDTERFPEDNARTRYLSNEEYERLLTATRISGWNKLTALVMLAVTTGGRRGALVGLHWSDLNLEAGTAKINRTKNGEAFTLVLLPDVIKELRRFMGSKEKSGDLVFCGKNPTKPMGFGKAWTNALKDSNLENTDVVFHSLRHTHASWLAQNGAPLLAIAESMGHKSLVMTKRYSHLCIDSR
ncbi:MAG: hypothetical protein RL517_195, partial [Pseudomonadota bacterium]